MGPTAREGIDVELRKGDFARSWGELGAGVLKPVPIWGLRICCLSVSVVQQCTRIERTYHAFPNLTLETQIGLAQFGAFLTKLSNLGALKERKKGVKRVACAQREGALTDLRTTSMIWVNMDSILETLAPELGWELFMGEMRWRA